MCHSHTLEEVARYHLETHDWEHCKDDSDSFFADFNEFLVCGENLYEGVGEKFGYKKTECGDAGGADDCINKHFVHTVEFTCSIVVAGDWLHSLVQTHHNHNEDKYYPVYDSVCANCKVASMFLETLVDDDNNYAGCHVH